MISGVSDRELAVFLGFNMLGRVSTHAVNEVNTERDCFEMVT